MYIPKHFDVADQKEIYEFIDQNSFGQLVSTVNGRLFSSHIPFLLSSDRKSLLCHVAKSNPQHKEIESQEVLVTLQGEHGYISPSWYEHPGAPTWNYQAVHIYGKCSLIKEPEKLADLVEALTAKYESGLSNPWQPDYSKAMLNNIVGIQINIHELQCKYKLSQNRSESDRRNVISELNLAGFEQLVSAMKEN